jgi:hypothetical protein
VWKLTPCKGFHGYGGLSEANGENGQGNGDGDVLDRVHGSPRPGHEDSGPRAASKSINLWRCTAGLL